MKILAWLLLLIALACGVVWGAGSWLPMLTQHLSSDVRGAMFYAAPAAQALGVFLMRRNGARGWPVILGVVAAALWLIAIVAISLSNGAGATMVIGIIFMLPAIGIAALLQLGAMVGFAMRKSA